MKTRTDLIIEVLDLLGVSQTGQQPAAEDVEKVDQSIDGKFSELARRKVFYVQDRNAIDEDAFQPLATLVANAVAPKFGVPRDPDVEIREERRLKDIDRSPLAFSTLRTEYI